MQALTAPLLRLRANPFKRWLHFLPLTKASASALLHTPLLHRLYRLRDRITSCRVGVIALSLLVLHKQPLKLSNASKAKSCREPVHF